MTLALRGKFAGSKNFACLYYRESLVIYLEALEVQKEVADKIIRFTGG
jgi:hypothetical protein